MAGGAVLKPEERIQNRVTKVTDVPEYPGAGQIHFENGESMLAVPEVADEWRERLGHSVIAEGVAGPGTGPEPARVPAAQQVEPPADPDAWKTKVGGALGKFGAPGSVGSPDWVPPATAAPAPAADESGGAPPATTAAPAPATGQPAPDAEGEPADPALAASNARLSQMLATGRRDGGAPQPFRPAGFSPDTRKVVNEAGAPYDPAAAQERIAAAKMVLDAQMAKAASDKEGADATAAHARVQNIAAQEEYARRQSDIIRKQQDFQRQDSALQKDLADYSESAKPDPRKYFSTPAGAFSGFLSIIAQGLGAFGATLGHTENWAFKAAQQQIQNEMSAQEKAYDAGRGDRKNALARFVDYYHGDMDLAKLGLQQALNKVGETETARFAAQSRSKEITNTAKILAAQFAQEAVLNEQKRKEAAEGKTTSTYDEKYHGASGGGAGGAKLSLDDELKLRKALGAQEALSPDKQADIGIKYGEQRRNLDAAQQGSNEQAERMGLKIDWKAGQVLGKDGKPVDASKVNIPGIGTFADKAPDWAVGVEGRLTRNVMKKAIDAYRKESTGVAYSPEELEAATNQFIGFSNEDTVRNLQKHVEELAAKKRSLEAGFGKKTVDTDERRARETNIEHAKAGRDAPKVTSYE